MNKFLDDHKPKPTKSKPENPKPPTNGFEAIAGRYHDAAYGLIELHPLITARNAGEPAWSFTTKFDKIFCKELLFEHFDGDIFNVTAKITFETGAVICNMTGQGIQAQFGEGGMDFSTSGGRVFQMATWRGMELGRGPRCSLLRFLETICTDITRRGGETISHQARQVYFTPGSG
jgi:hypothetical protein